MLKSEKKLILIGTGILLLIGITITLCLVLRKPSNSKGEIEDITVNEDETINEDTTIYEDETINEDITIYEDVIINDDGIIDEQEKMVLDLRLDRDITMMEMAFGEEETPGYLEDVEELRTYEILDATREENVIYATVFVKAPDLYTIVKNLQIEGELTAEKINAALIEALQDAVLVEKEVELIYQEVNGVWKAILTEEFVDAYTGGLLRVRDEYYNDILRRITNEN